MDVILIFLVGPFIYFWEHLLVGLSATAVAVAGLQRLGISRSVQLQLEGILAFAGPVFICAYVEDLEVGHHLPSIPAFGAALDLLLLNFVLLLTIERLCRKTVSSPPPKP